MHALADCGRVTLVDIGLDLPDTDLLGFDADDVKALWPVPGPHDDKYSQGWLASWPVRLPTPGCGSVHRSGGCRHLGNGALRRHRCRTGGFTLAGGCCRPRRAGGGQVQAWAVGPGLGTNEAAMTALTFALNTDFPVIVDADGLTLLAAHPHLVTRRVAPTVLTPHAGEFARLNGGQPPGGDRVASARSWPRHSEPPCCSRATSRS